MLLPASGAMLKAASMTASCAALKARGVTPSCATISTDLVTSAAVGRSLKSTSVKLKEPLSPGPASQATLAKFKLSNAMPATVELTETVSMPENIAASKVIVAGKVVAVKVCDPTDAPSL